MPSYQHRAGIEGRPNDENTSAMRRKKKLTYRRRSRPIRQPRRYDDPPYPPRSHPPHGLLQSRYRRSVPERPAVRRAGIDGAVYFATVPRAGRRHDVVDRHDLAVRRGRRRRRCVFDAAGSDVGVLETGGGGDVVEVRRRVRRRGGGAASAFSEESVGATTTATRRDGASRRSRMDLLSDDDDDDDGDDGDEDDGVSIAAMAMSSTT